ncbi:MAG TPA: hypothetical protein PKM57_02115 [Kiritimatiellia bacterium]|nr:hypothetical protein [Kiritimatiellia bacterium]
MNKQDFADAECGTFFRGKWQARQPLKDVILRFDRRQKVLTEGRIE